MCTYIAEFDIGVYFEANGHGTIVFSEAAQSLIKVRNAQPYFIFEPVFWIQIRNQIGFVFSSFVDQDLHSKIRVRIRIHTIKIRGNLLY